MISNEYKKVEIDNIGGGVVKELFKRELLKVCENIDDVNTNAKDARVITLKISLKPSEDRTTADVWSSRTLLDRVDCRFPGRGANPPDRVSLEERAAPQARRRPIDRG